MATELKGPEKRRFETRERLLSVAQTHFSEKGYHNTQVMDIVKTARMSAGTFYNYFTDKKDIFEQLIENNLNKIRKETKRYRTLPENFMDLSTDQRRAVLNEMLHAIHNNLFDYFDRYPQQMLMTIRGIFGVDGDTDQKVMEFYNGMAQDMLDDIEHWERITGFKGKLNKLIYAHAILGSLFQVAHIYLTQQSFSREEAIETLIKSMMPNMLPIFADC